MSDITIYQRGRRAAERGAPRVVPFEYTGTYATATEWLLGYNSIYGGHKPATVQDAVNLLTLADEGVMDAHDAIKQALDILEELV